MQEEMTSRERVLKAVNHEEPDRIPFDFASTLVTGINVNAYLRLAEYYLGIKPEKIELYDTAQQLPIVDEIILKELGVDIRGLIPNFGRKNPIVEDKGDHYLFKDEWSEALGIQKEGEHSFSNVEPPLAGNITEQDIDDFPWPNPTDPALFDGLEKKAKAYYDKGYAVILESLCAGIFEMYWRMRGYDQFIYDCSDHPNLVHKLLDKIVELKIEFYKTATEKLGEYVQFIRESDDLADQRGLLITSEQYHEFIRPRHEKLFKAQKDNFPEPFYTFFHSCGNVYDLIQDFIDIGVNVLNPVQLSAEGMNAEKLKAEYGQKLAFWGGGVDTQHVFPHGTPEQVEQNVEKNIKALKPNGGFIFGAIHNILDDVPTENILAMLDTYKKLRYYKA